MRTRTPGHPSRRWGARLGGLALAFGLALGGVTPADAEPAAEAAPSASATPDAEVAAELDGEPETGEPAPAEESDEESDEEPADEETEPGEETEPDGESTPDEETEPDSSPTPTPTPEPEPATVIVVNSARFGGANLATATASGTCDTGQSVTRDDVTLPECTLRAAIELSNALNAPAGDVRIQVITGLGLGADEAITIPNATTDYMLSTATTLTNFSANQVTLAAYRITAPVTIDLDNRLRFLLASNTAGEFATFYVDATDVNLLNFTNVRSVNTAILISGTAQRVTVDGGQSFLGLASALDKRFLVIENGAQNITFRNYQVGGLATGATADYGAVVFDNKSTTAVTRNVVIENVQFRQPDPTCTSPSGTYCVNQNNAIVLGTSTSRSPKIDGLTIQNSRFQYLSGRSALMARYVTAGNLANFTFTGNTLKDNFVASGTDFYNAVVVLPAATGALIGTNTINNNTFNNAALATSSLTNRNQPYAIGGNAGGGTNKVSGLTITGNAFDGFTTASVYLTADSGLVPVRGNTFGPNSGSQAVVTTAEGFSDVATNTEESVTADAAAALVRQLAGTNHRLHSWAPADYYPDPDLRPSPQVANPTTCTATVWVAPPTSADLANNSTIPATPVTLHLYWTALATAEVYLGSFGPYSQAGELTFTVPAQAIGAFGQLGGYLRLQTETSASGAAETSQFSRTVALRGTCSVAQAPATTTIYVNSARFGGPNLAAATAGRTCDTGQTVTLGGQVKPECTLRAAIELANAINGAVPVTVTLDADLPEATIAATGDYTSADWMLPSTAGIGAVSWRTPQGAYWAVKAPMTIDLKNRLHVAAVPDIYAAAFHVQAPYVTLLGLTDIIAGSDAVVVASNAAYVTISGGSTVQTTTGNLTRFLYVRNGARNVTFSDYTLSGLLSVDDDSGAGGVVFQGDLAKTTRQVEIARVTFDNPLPGTTCTAYRGCSANGVNVWTNARVYGLEIHHSTFQHTRHGAWLAERYPISAYFVATAGSLGNFRLHDNDFLDNINIVSNPTGWIYSLVMLPYGGGLLGTNSLDHNTFDNATTIQEGVREPIAIGWLGLPTGTTASRVTISDNYFDGFAIVGIQLQATTGLVTMQRNTFGPNSASTGIDEADMLAAAAKGLISNGADTVNQRIRSWAPDPASAAVAENCQASVRVKPPTSTANYTSIPPTPVTVELYWTATNQAEVYLGAYPNLAAAATLAFTVPPEAVGADNLTVGGYLRVQTHTDNGGAWGQLASSAYSAKIALTGTCDVTPRLEIAKRAWSVLGLADPDYDGLVTGGAAAELPSGVTLGWGTVVWWTYTVANTGYGTLKNVVVTDSDLGEVCVIAALAPGQSAGCLAHGPLAPAEVT